MQSELRGIAPQRNKRKKLPQKPWICQEKDMHCLLSQRFVAQLLDTRRVAEVVTIPETRGADREKQTFFQPLRASFLRHFPPGGGTVEGHVGKLCM